MTIIESLTSIKINSAFFETSTELGLFPALNAPKRNRVALIYGKNGSGKSSIAQGFRELRENADPRTVTITPLASGRLISQQQNSKSEKFFIFDEKYIKNSVSIKDNGLDAIVLFGEQVQLEAEIQNVSDIIETKETQQQAQEEDMSNYTNKTNVVSPLYWYKEIEASLKGNGCWSENSSKIKGNKKNDSVTKDVINKIGMLQPAKSLSDLQAEFDSQFPLYLRAGAKSELISKAVSVVSISSTIEEDVKALLAKTIQKPTMTERENELLQIFGIDGVSRSKTFLSIKENFICPTCLQKVDDVYRTEILSRIEAILNKDVEEMKSKLRKLKLGEINTDDYQIYSGLKESSIHTANVAIATYNNAINKHNDLIDAKINNPFDSSTYDIDIGLISANEDLNRAITKLEEERASYNDSITKKKSVRDKLLSLNDELAHFAITDYFKRYTEQQDAQKRHKTNLDKLKKEITDLKTKKNQLDAQRQNFKIAVDEINHSLKYIFFSDKRLALTLGDDGLYHLKVNDKQVDPNRISCGERNALALCYFFTEIAQETDVQTIYSDEVLLVIDDPISSFDLENKMGIMSFLRWKLEQVLNGCEKSKILIMSHDISVVFYLGKVFEEISSYCKSKKRYAEYKIFELINQTLCDFKYKARNDYSTLMESVFIYGKDGSPSSEITIGNSMRRILEAFSTFSYKEGIDKISRNDSILSIISDDKTRHYFKNLMYRLVLHGESHYEDYMRGLQNMDFFGCISSAEKQRTAKEIICFMYLLNKEHVLAHLKSEPSAEQTINSWCSNIASHAS